jgi:GntR family transcriptional repressor for pyruvate dehydrogenase complex
MRDLLAEIAVGELAPGDMLPRELDLAARYQVSRGVVRECIRGLEERGVIAVKHGRGATVTSPERWDVLDPDVLRALLDAPAGEQLVSDAVECQRLLEVEAAGLAAERAQHEDLDALTHALERMSAAAGHAATAPAAADRYHEADLHFHRTVVKAAGNRALARMSAPLHRALATAARERGATAGTDRRVAEHRKIVSAIAARDPAAARDAMAAHLHAGTRTLLARRRPVRGRRR